MKIRVQPFSARSFVEASVLNLARDYDGVIAQAQRVIARNPDFADLNAWQVVSSAVQ
jgi:hypothetical protein